MVDCCVCAVTFSSADRRPSGTAQLRSTCTDCCKVSQYGGRTAHSAGSAALLPSAALTHAQTCFQSWRFLLTLRFLLSVSTQTEAVLLEPEEDSTSIMLYVTVGNIKVSSESSDTFSLNKELHAGRTAGVAPGSALKPELFFPDVCER